MRLSSLRPMRLVLFVLLALGLMQCGNKGGLYRPPQPEVVQEPSQDQLEQPASDPTPSPR